MFKNVAKAFWKYLYTILLAIIAFAFTLYIFMKPVIESKEHILSPYDTLNLTKLELETIIANIMKASNDEEDVNHNFENIYTSILKTLEMLSGEFTIEPFNLKSNLQLVVFFCFVITSLLLFNFILGFNLS